MQHQHLILLGFRCPIYDGQITYLRGSLIRSADNSAANLIGGYKFQKCRACMAVEWVLLKCSLIIIITVYDVTTSVVCTLLLIQFHEVSLY